jgi:hypothetical protein
MAAWFKGMRQTYIFVVNDHPLTVCDVDAVRCSNPPLPGDTIDPSKPNLSALSFFHIDAHALGSSQGALISAVFCLLNPQLLGITEFLSLALESLCLLVHPFQGRILDLAFCRKKLSLPIVV